MHSDLAKYYTVYGKRACPYYFALTNGRSKVHVLQNSVSTLTFILFFASLGSLCSIFYFCKFLFILDDEVVISNISTIQ